MLRWYAGGVVFYSGVKAAAPAFVSRGDVRTPVKCAMAGIAVNILVSLVLIDHLGVGALALAVSLGAATNYGLLRLLDRRIHGAGAGPGLGELGRVALAAAVMGGAGWGAWQAGWLGTVEAAPSLLGTLRLLAAVAALGALYFGLAAALGLRTLVGIFRRGPAPAGDAPGSDVS